MSYIRKTRDIFEVHWMCRDMIEPEFLTAELSRKEARQRLREYSAEWYRVFIKVIREKIWTQN